MHATTTSGVQPRSEIMTNLRYSFPLFVYPMRRCNFACTYCFTESGPAQPATSFVLEHWQELMEQAHDLGVPEVRLSGGEPLLIDILEHLCETLTRLGMSYTVTTNGALLKRHLTWMTRNPPQTIWLSLHTEYISHHRFMALVAKAVRHLPIVGVNLFDIDVIATPDLPVRSVEAGARRIKIVHRTTIGRNAAGTRAAIMPAIGPIAEKLHSIRAVEFRVESPAIPGTPRGPDSCALATRPLLSLDHDGRVYPCCVTVGYRPAAVGDLRLERLAAVVARGTDPSIRLPCSPILPALNDGRLGCPLSLVQAT